MLYFVSVTSLLNANAISQFPSHVQCLRQNGSNTGYSKFKVRNYDEFRKDWSQLLKMQVPNGTGPSVRRSERALLASRIRCKFSMDTSRNFIMSSKSVIRSRVSEMSDQSRVSLHMVMPQNVM